MVLFFSFLFLYFQIHQVKPWANGDLQEMYSCVQLLQILGSSDPQFQSVMTCNRGHRNRFRSFKILSPGLPKLSAMDNIRRVSDVSVEHAFVTINKWIPIKVRSTRFESNIIKL